MAISTNGTVLARLAGGLYNQTLSNATYNEVVAVVKSAADINTLANDLYARDFASKTDLSVAKTLVANLGLSTITGLDNWVSAQLTAAGAAKGAKIVSLLNDLSNLTSDATYGSYATAFNAKTDAALALSQTAASKGGDFSAAATLAAAQAAADAAAAAAKSAADAAAKAAADKAAADAAAKVIADADAAANAPQTFTLTTNADSGASFTGKNGADTFNAVIGTDGLVTNGTTLNPGDNLQGSGGTDTLVVSISGTNTGDATQSLASFTTNGIETLNINNYETRTTGASLIDLAQATGLTTIGLTGSSASGDTTLTSVKNIVNAKMQYGSGDLTLTYADAAVAGAADVQNLELTGVTGGTFTAQATATGDVESVTVTSLGGVRNVLTGITNSTNLKTINVAGDTAVTLGTLGAAVTKLDASASTGGVTVVNGNATAAVTGSSGNDAITMTVAATTGTVNAGAGTDSLTLRDSIANGGTGVADTIIASTTNGAKFTGFETLNVSHTDAGNAATVTAYTDRVQDVGLVSGITSVGLTTYALTGTTNDDTDAATSVTYSNLSSSVKNLNISGLSYADGTDANNDSITLTVTASLATNTANDDITVTLGTATAAAGNALAAGTDALLLTATLNNFDTVNLVSQGAANAINTLNDSELKTLSASGSKDLTVGLAGNTLTSSINASAMTGAFIMTANGSTTASTVAGGAGNDSLIGGSRADSISGNDGNDSITGADGNDTISGGAGNDTIDAGAGIDRVDAGDGDDQINVSTVSDFIGLSAAEVVIGGAGNDNLVLSTGGNAAWTVTANDLLGISSVDRLTINGGSSAGSVTLNDAVFTANGLTQLRVIDGTLTAGTLAVDAGALTAANSVYVIANTSTTVNDTLTGGAGADTFVFATTAGLESTDTVTGGAGTDVILLDASAAVTANLTGVRTVEQVTTTGNGGNVIITVGASTISATGTLTVNASSVTNGTNTLNYDGSNVTSTLTGSVQNVTGTAGADTIKGGPGADILVGGDGADTITGGAGIDNLSGGNGDDVFVVGTATHFTGLTSAESVAGGSGNDTLQFSAATGATVNAGDLVGLTSIEVLQTADTTGSFSVTLGDAFYASNGVSAFTIDAGSMTTGDLTVNASGLSAANAITVTRNAATANGGDSIVLGAGSDTLKVYSDILAAATTTLTGGAGTDTIEITHGADTRTLTALVTGFEKITFATASVANTISLTTDDANVAAGVTFTVDGSNQTAAVTFDGKAEADGKFSVIGGSGADNITGGALADTISGGTGVDTITGGNGADVLTGGADSADTFVFATPTTGSTAYTTVQSNSSNTDTITDFVSGTDKLQVELNYSQVVSALTVDATVQTARAGTSLIQDNLSGARGQAVYDTVGGALWVNYNGDNLLTTTDWKINVNAAATATATIGSSDINFVITGGSAADTITAGGGADTINGGAGDDSITGGAGDDSITAGTGADTIVGGTGNDTIILGGTGSADQVWLAATGTDTITGFSLAAADADKLVVSANGSMGIAIAGAAAVATQQAAAATGSVFIQVNGGAADYTQAEVIALLATTATANKFTVAASSKYILIETRGGNSQVWYVNNDATAAITTAEVTKVGIVDATLAFADLA